VLIAGLPPEPGVSSKDKVPQSRVKSKFAGWDQVIRRAVPDFPLTAFHYPQTSGDYSDHGQDCQDGRSQKDDGHIQEHGLPQMRQADPHRKAGQGPRTQRARRDFYFLLRLRILRKTLTSKFFHGRLLIQAAFDLAALLRTPTTKGIRQSPRLFL